MDRKLAKIKADLIDLNLVKELENIDHDFESRGLGSSGPRLRARAQATIKAQLEKQLLLAQSDENETISQGNIPVLVNALPTKDKRLKSARVMAKLLNTGEIISPFRLAKCLNNKLTRKNYDFKTKKYLADVENRVRTIRKYWKQHGYTVVAVNFTELGYQRKQLNLH